MRYEHARWCDSCQQHHGVMYICPSYTNEKKLEIYGSKITFKNNLNDESFIEGVPKEVVNIFEYLMAEKV